MSRKIAITGITAAVYVALTWILLPISYGMVQLRVSEVMTLLAFAHPVFVPGLILGTFVANINSPTPLPDMIMGTAATAVAVFMMTRTKNIWLASLWPTLSNGIIIGLELYLFVGTPLLASVGFVALGEFVTVTIIGCPLYLAIKSRHKLFGMIQGR